MEGSRCDFNLRYVSLLYQIRVYLGWALLSSGIAAPIATSILGLEVQIKEVVFWHQLGFSSLYTFEIAKRFRRGIESNFWAKLFVGLVCLQLMGWVLKGRPVFMIPQLNLYLVQVPFVLALVEWCEVGLLDRLRKIFLLKLAVLLVSVSGYFLGIYGLNANSLSVGKAADYLMGYSHIRHLNYDLYYLTFMLSLLVVSKNIVNSFLIFVLGVSIGFLTFWSGGRAQLVSIVCLFLGAFVLNVVVGRELIVRVALPIFFGGFCVFLLGMDGLFLRAVDKSMALENLQTFTSGRWGMWADSLIYAKQAWVFGYGPDAYLRMRYEIGSIQSAVQPHSSIVQVALEFGAVGLTGALLVLVLFCRRLVGFGRSAVGIPVVFFSCMFSLFVYSLFDGVFYHATSLWFFSIVVAAYFLICESSADS